MTVAASYGCKPDDINGIIAFVREASTLDLRRLYQDNKAEFKR